MKNSPIAVSSTLDKFTGPPSQPVERPATPEAPPEALVLGGSTVDQNTGRQLYGQTLDRVFTDHISGVTRNRRALEDLRR